MISHERAQELISSRMDAPLTPAEHHELQVHLASCGPCRAFVTHIDEMARGLQGMTHLAASPTVSRAVISSISAEAGGWGWLRHGLRALSSPGMAVASSLALVLALAGALIVALNAPGSDPGTERAAQPEGTIAAVAVAPLPTEVPTLAPEPTAVPTEPPAPEPTATRGPGRTIAPAPTRAPEETPKPRPTATSVPVIEAAQSEPVNDSPAIQPVVEEPVYDESAANEPTLAMDTGESAETAEFAQDAIAEEPVVEEQIAEDPAAVEDTVVQEIAEPVEETAASEPVVADEPVQEGKTASADEAVEPLPTRPVGPVPVEAIAALEGAGNAPDISLPPAPLDPLMPNQDFLPVTPTPVPAWEGTPTPESPPATESEAPQLAEDPSADLGVANLAPPPPMVAEAPSQTVVESDEKTRREKRDKSDKSGGSHENQQAAYVEAPFGWSSNEIDWSETLAEPVALYQTTEYPSDTTLPAEPAAETAIDPATGQPIAETTESDEPAREIDPATGMEIDPATGYLIDPTTGYLLDRVNGRIIDSRTSFEVHPMTGLLIDPASGALLDPNTLAVVIPPGFGDDQPGYVPGSPDMRGQIETVVDDTYNNASIRLEPPTDGPVQPIGEIIVPTESGDALEIS